LSLSSLIHQIDGKPDDLGVPGQVGGKQALSESTGPVGETGRLFEALQREEKGLLELAGTGRDLHAGICLQRRDLDLILFFQDAMI